MRPTFSARNRRRPKSPNALILLMFCLGLGTAACDDAAVRTNCRATTVCIAAGPGDCRTRRRAAARAVDRTVIHINIVAEVGMMPLLMLCGKSRVPART